VGHFLFIVLHIIALVFFAVALFVTIPLHLIYAAFGGRKPAESTPSPKTHVRCPECKEPVLNEARRCKHCGAKLVPLSVQLELLRQARAAANAGKSWWQRLFAEINRPR
jgi:hypothetical protein